MVQQLGALAALPEEPRSSPSTHKVAYSKLKLQSLGTHCPLLASAGTAFRVHTWIGAKHSQAYKIFLVKSQGCQHSLLYSASPLGALALMFL